MQDKEHLVVFFAAGASVHAGVPSTGELTDLIANAPITTIEPYDLQVSNTDDHVQENPLRAYPNVKRSPICKIVHKALKSIFNNPNFEHTLAALEELQSVVMSQNHISDDEYVNALSAFVSIDSRYSSLQHMHGLVFARQEIIRLISTEIQDQLRQRTEPESETRRFLDKLREKYSLSAFTLNYDDLLDRSSVDWYDGFNRLDQQPLRYGDFHPANFIRTLEDKDVDLLCHLHGSIRFGYRIEDDKSKRVMELVRYHSGEEAYKTLVAMKPDNIVNGLIVSAPPIISGFNKVAKLTHSPAPYGHYYRAFVDRLLSTPKLLIVGYGGADEHINTWLREYVRVHQSDRRIGFVSLFRERQDFERNAAACKLMSELSDYDVKAFSKPSPSFQEHRYLGLFTGGFPMTDSDTEQLVSFLSAKTVRRDYFYALDQA